MTARKVKKMQEEKSAKVKEPKLFSKQYFKKYPGVIIALIVFIVLIVVALYFIGASNPEAQEELAFAMKVHTNTQSNLLYLQESIALIVSNSVGEEAEYYNSATEEILLLKELDNKVYESGLNDIHIRTFASFYFIESMLNISNEVLYDYYEGDKQAIIDAALETDASVDVLLEYVDMNYLFENDYEKKVFNEQLDSLIEKYVAAKKSIINGDYSDERKYIEAKKIILSSYSGE